MNFTNLERANDHEVENWLKQSLSLNDYQRQRLLHEDIVRFSPYYFFKRKRNKSSRLARLTIVALPVAWILLMLSLPVNFIITGTWGYDNKRIKWWHDWLHSVGM